MKKNLFATLGLVALFHAAGLFSPAQAQFAVQVVSYNQGTTPAFDFGSGMPYNLPAGALGSPERFTNDSVFPECCFTIQSALYAQPNCLDRRRRPAHASPLELRFALGRRTANRHLLQRRNRGYKLSDWPSRLTREHLRLR